ncbi:winged helix DNA-binding protein [Novosphingobium terrae]|uniref:winged helix DNA-binding protein n=1 Tax=Novosphingobium terrae TaxID=2726189 RepID=UPI0019810B05|nr:winged helix DNA-binding protein [Novosphingobium terrae]
MSSLNPSHASHARFAGFTDDFPDFSYGHPANDAAGLRLSVSVFADRGHLRDEMGEDATSAGFRLADTGRLHAVLDGAARPLGDVVLIDCPQVDGATMAALARLDMRAVHVGAQLIVSTSVEALDDVFAALDQSDPQILVGPSRAERIIALGHVLARLPQRRVRELSEEDRLVLLRLTQQVTQIAERIDRLGGGAPAAAPATPAVVSAFRFDTAPGDEAEERVGRAARPALPDPRLVRRIIRQRQLRARHFEGELFADPAWDMLLDLTAARAEHARVSVTSLCIASGVPPTTALRWIGQMTDAGLFKRVEDETDRRRAFITLTDKAVDAMARYFAEIDLVAARMS